jgi:uncharacterized MAPEG superfamily protein
MTTPLWCLLGFTAWTLLLVTIVGAWRAADVVRGVKRANEFPSGVPHGSDLYWRLNRAHQNCAENLPIFASLVLVATVTHLDAPALSTLSMVVLAARLGQSLTHLSSGSSQAVNVRFTLFVTQLASYAFMLVTMIGQARERGLI